MTRQPNKPWRVGGASIRGSAHVRSETPNQDCWLSRADRAMRASILAVADGHGARAHFRSDKGAALAVQAAAAVLDAQIEDADGGELAGAILARWRADVRAHMGVHPYTDAERRLADHPPLSPYGATLIAAGLSDSIVAVVQIGDGDLLLGYPDGRLERPLPVGPALEGERTFSLCQEDALAWFQSAVLWRNEDRAWPDFVFMSTDGVSKSFRDEASFLSAVTRLHERAHADWQGLVADAPGWLTTVSSNGSGDDATLCVAARLQS